MSAEPLQGRCGCVRGLGLLHVGVTSWREEARGGREARESHGDGAAGLCMSQGGPGRPADGASGGPGGPGACRMAGGVQQEGATHHRAPEWGLPWRQAL